MILIKHITLFLLFSFSLVLAANSVHQRIANGLYDGRSSDIIISPKTFVEDDSFVILNSVGGLYHQDNIEDVGVADLVSHILGTQPMSQNSRSALPPLDPFEKLRANLLIAVEALGENTASSVPGGQKLKLKKSIYPASVSSLLNTISTGETPSHHGIVADSWKTPKGEHIEAFQGEEGHSVLSNYADLLSQTYDGRSLTLSVSLHQRVAHAFAAHKQTFSENNQWNNARISFNHAENVVSIESTSEIISSEFEFSSEQLLEALKSVPYVEVGNEKIIVTLPGQVPFEFNLNVHEDLDFALEMGLAQKLVEQIKTSPTLQGLTSDQFPDSFAIVYTSLKSLQKSYGADSDNVRVARALLQIHINNVIEQLSASYSNSLASEILFLGSATKSHFAALRERLPSQVSKITFPYVPNTEESHDETCNLVQAALEGSEYEAHCLKGTFSRHLHTRQSDEDNSMLYVQSILWGVIAWLITLYLIISSMASINGGKDTMLYRSTTGLRHQHAA